MELGPLTLDDLPAAVALSTQAGWNQTPEDWRRILAHSPEGCFAGRLEGRLVATATAAFPAPGIAWIGMVLVDQACPGRGFGTRILERALGVKAEVVGLDATDLGRPLYLKLGFKDVAPIDRWGGTPAAGPTDAREVSIERILELDREALGVDRSALLKRLAAEAGVRLWATRDGYVMLRPGRLRSHLGPVVAADPLPFLRAGAGRPLIVDVLRRPELESAYRAGGLEVERRLTRMTLGAAKPVLLNAAAAVAFEWG